MTVNREDIETIEAMRLYGGSFVVALAEAASRADVVNLSRLKSAFPDYWAEYQGMAKRGKENASHA